ncbi:MAG: hypothetical protein L0K86_22090 [Actinomycetia bacterium]|nr:hypothetical protein [Actinomycetes bacterium]
MRRFAGVAALAVGSVMMMTPVVAGAAPAPIDGSVRAQSLADGHAKGKTPGETCVTRKEFRRLDTRGKGASSPRQVRRIVGDNGKRDSLSRAIGYRWEIRKYLRCNSEIRHMYVNYRDNRSYRKAW